MEWGDGVGTSVIDLAYGKGEANRFDLYLPADSARDAYGLVVYLHPGGFTAGDKSGDAEMCQWLCSLGYVSASINYTLFSEDHPEASVLTQSEEIRDAMPCVVAAAEERGYHVDQMAIAGGSAGGCLALVYAYRDGAKAPVPLRLVFEAVGPASMYREDWANYGMDQSAEAAVSLLSAMSGTMLTVEQIEDGSYLDVVRPISAVDWVSDESVPTVMCYGAHDRIAPHLSSVRLDSALTEHGVDHAYFVCEHSGHGLQNDDAVYGQYLAAIVDYLDRYMPVS